MDAADTRVFPTRRPARPDLLAVFSLALAVRLLLTATSSGGFTGNVGYDQSVYFTAADALTYGRLPYADFLLLHPPGIMFALAPFALLARLTGDHAAFITANVVFACIGALNAALITRIAFAWGLSRRAGLVGGVFYAVWLSAAGPELSARLEPLGTLAFVGAVLALSRAARPSGRAAIVGGAALGFAASVKIWWVVPLLVLLAWFGLARRDARTTRRLVIGAVATVAVVCGPFFVSAPTQMWRMVVSDQLGRNSAHTSKLGRLLKISSLDQVSDSRLVMFFVAGLVAATCLLLVIRAWRCGAARPYVLVAAAQLIVLVFSPSYFGYYSGFFAAGAALVLAASSDGSKNGVVRRRVPWSAAVVASLVVVVGAVVTGHAIVATSGVTTPKPLAVGDVPRRLTSVRCIVADSPMALIATNSLSRGLAAGCPNWVDVSGRTYDVDANPAAHVARSRNRKWQRDVKAYLLSGQAVIIVRRATGLSKKTRSAIDSLPVLARHGTVVVHRVDPNP